MNHHGRKGKLILSLLLATTILGCYAEQQTHLDFSVLDLGDGWGIVNGTPVQSGDPMADSTVALYSIQPNFENTAPRLVDFCTGTLITRHIVLTAAHCLADVAEQMEIPLNHLIKNIRIGFGIPTVSSLDDKRVEFRSLQEIKVHENYRVNSVAEAHRMPMYDIALIKMDRPAPAGAKPVKIVTNAALIRQGLEITLVGFGLIQSFPQKDAEQMMKVSVTVDNPSINPVQFSYKVQGGRSACSGDSGGPAYVRLPKGEIAVIGITSWGDRMCSRIGVYTSVPRFSSWIRENIAQL